MGLDMFGRSRSMGTAKSHRSQALEAMQRNKRMARTLGCLVASMTLGAALLDWVQPKRLPAATTRTELMSIVNRDTPRGTWRSIQLDSQTPGTRGVASHFIISRDGLAYPTSRWQTQQSAGAEGTVRIHLLSAGNSNQVTPEQWKKANELVRALQRECSIAQEQVHCDELVVPTVSEPTPTKTPVSPTRSSRK
jgi:hypothetical protein